MLQEVTRAWVWNEKASLKMLPFVWPRSEPWVRYVDSMMGWDKESVTFGLRQSGVWFGREGSWAPSGYYIWKPSCPSQK